MKRQKNTVNLRKSGDSKFRAGSRGSEDGRSLKNCKGSEDGRSLINCKGSESSKCFEGRKSFADFQNPKGMKGSRDSLQRESLALRFLYRTIPGRVLLKVLTLPAVSRAAGRILDSRVSVCLIPYFIRKNHICTRRVIVPAGGFRSFNQFFCREEARGRSQKQGETLLSPCDGYLTRIPIRKGVIFDIKHTKFTLGELLKDPKLTQEFQEGCACVFRLTPAEYHRYGYAASGKVLQRRQIPGRLHCVRPIATETVPVFAQNAREYEVIRTAGFGKIVQMEVGALLIGRITNRPAGPGGMVRAGEEKGYFEFGGSTIVVLLKEGILDCPEEAEAEKTEAGEIYVRRGQRILT